METDRFNRAKMIRPTQADPYMDFIRAIWSSIPGCGPHGFIRCCWSRLHRQRLRRLVARLRPEPREAFLRLRSFPGQEAQADWAHFGEVRIGTARRRLSCFVLTLSHSRALFLEFFFDQTLENFLRGHVDAFADWGGVPRILLYDNLRSAVLERNGNQIRFHPRLIELSAHYHCQPRPVAPARGNQKGRASERFVTCGIRRPGHSPHWKTSIARHWCGAIRWPIAVPGPVATSRPWPRPSRQQPLLMSLPVHRFDTDRVQPVRSGKTIYIRFDLNDYSIPPDRIGQTLTLVASQTGVRLLDGTTEVAAHRRSYDRHQLIVDPAHQDALLEEKRKARGSTAGGRLATAVPETEFLLQAAFERGESIQRQSRLLLGLLDDSGPSELRAAVSEALEQDTPRADSVAFILQKRWRAQKRRASIPVAPSRADLADIHVQPHHAETYDDLYHVDESEPEQ